MGTGGNVGAGGNGVSASQGGTAPSGGDSGGGYYTTHDFTGYGTNGIGGPNAVGSTGVLNNGLAAGPGDHAGFQGGYLNAPGYGTSYGQAVQALEKELGFAPGTYAARQNPANLTSNFGSLFGGALSGGGQDYGGHWFGTSPASYAGAANPGNDVGGLFGRGGVLGSGMGLGTLGQSIGMTALGAVNPLLGMGVGGMLALANGANPGGVAGSMGAGMLSPVVGSALAGLGPIGQIAAPFAGQALSYAMGQGGAAAYNGGYGAPASQGPAAAGSLGGAASPPASAGAGSTVSPGNTQVAGLSDPAVTAPVSNPVAGPLANLLKNGGLNLPLLLAALNRRTA
jgi:hypothetical protein